VTKRWSESVKPEVSSVTVVDIEKKSKVGRSKVGRSSAARFATPWPR
jgi:hypothetical protein